MVFRRRTRDLRCVVHDDDLTFAGISEDLLGQIATWECGMKSKCGELWARVKGAQASMTHSEQEGALRSAGIEVAFGFDARRGDREGHGPRCPWEEASRRRPGRRRGNQRRRRESMQCFGSGRELSRSSRIWTVQYEGGLSTREQASSVGLGASQALSPVPPPCARARGGVRLQGGRGRGGWGRIGRRRGRRQREPCSQDVV